MSIVFESSLATDPSIHYRTFRRELLKIAKELISEHFEDGYYAVGTLLTDAEWINLHPDPINPGGALPRPIPVMFVCGVSTTRLRSYLP
jgi:hypothetical protein